MSRLKRNVLRFKPAVQERLDEMAEMAGDVLHKDVPRAAVVRAAVNAWLAVTDTADPAQLVKAIQGAMEPRGRKAT